MILRAFAGLGSADVSARWELRSISVSNRNVLWRHPEGVDTADLKRMTAFWGDESWREVAYTTTRDLFAHPEKEDNAVVAEGFRQVDAGEVTLRFCQEIYDEHGKLVEVHEKYPVDKGHQKE